MASEGEIINTESSELDVEKDNKLLEVQRILDQVTQALSRWYNSRDTDSIEVSGLRSRDYGEACQLIEERLIPLAGEAGYRVVLVAGDEQVQTIRTSKGAYDFISVHTSKPIPSGEELQLFRFERLNDHITRTATVYVGEYGRKVEVAEIAKALSSGSEISLVPIEGDAE